VLRLAFILAATIGLSAALPAGAQSPQKVFRVGHLGAPGKTPDGGPPRALVEALRALGYVEGRNIAYEARFAEGKLERLPELAADLVRLKMDVIVAQGGSAIEAARRATTTIPIVVAPAAGDAVAVGWISTLARPGGNITGLSDESVQLSAKRMELLKEAVPKAALIAIVWNANDHGMTLRYREIEKAARTLRVEVLPLGVREVEAFEAMTRRKPDAMFVVTDVFTGMNRRRFIEFAATHRIPAMYETSVYVREGGLMSYGPSFEDGFREAAGYIDRIFKGAKPVDLPAVQPRRYYLAVNLKVAAALGLTLPQSLLLRTDELIQQ
jgi:putative tryptophan/tyrosine transport system substrate-binding protein